MKPIKSILDPTFNYVPSAQTDLRKTFARIRKEMAKRKGTPEATQFTNCAAVDAPRVVTLRKREGP